MNLMPANQLGNHRHHHGQQQQSYEDTAVLSSFTVWSNFFLNAGIPASVAEEYALTFHQHRVRIDMLKEITKEILLDMGIKAMGDIIAILRHAKNVSAQDELKVGLGVKSSMSRVNMISDDSTPAITTTTATITNSNNFTATKHASTRPSLITSTNKSSVQSSNPSKIQSRVSSHSGALRTSGHLMSTGNHSDKKNNPAGLTSGSSRDISSSATANSSNNKRHQSSTISDSLAKRLCPAPKATSPDDGLPAHLTEKTLTVHYPPSYAKALAMAQRRLSHPTSTTNTYSEPVNASKSSIKSRIGSKVSDRHHSDHSPSQRTIPDKLNHSISSRVGSTMSSRISDKINLKHPNHHLDGSRASISKNKHTHDQSKSNVFDRLGGSR